MDDNEALDWGVGDQDDFDEAPEAYQQPQTEQARFDPEDNEDTISLGEDDDDQLLSYRNTVVDTVKLTVNVPPAQENRHISPVAMEPKAVGANRDSSTRVPAEKRYADSYDSRSRHRQERQESPPRRRGRRDDRSPRTPQSSANNTRVTHALPPKPVGSVVPLPPPSRVLVAEPTTISPRAGGRELKKQTDNGKPQSVSPASPPNRESRARSNNGENNYQPSSKPADATWQHPDSLPSRTNRAPITDNAHEKDSVQRSRSSAADPTGLSFEDRHYRPGSDLPANTSNRPSERSRPEPAPDRYPRPRNDRADSPPRDRARPRSPQVSDSRTQGYFDRHFMPSSYEPAPQDYRPDAGRRPGQRLDDHADSLKSKNETDRPSLRRRESSRGPRDRNPPRQSDMREPPISSLSSSRPRSPPRTRDSNPRYEENSGHRERRGWPEDQAPSNYPNRSGRRSPFQPPRSRPVPTAPANYADYYDRFQDHDPRLDPNLYPQEREREPMSTRRERPNDPEYSRYTRSHPPPPERSSRYLDNGRRSPLEERSVPQPPPRARSPLPPQDVSFQSRSKREAPVPRPTNPTPLPAPNSLPRKPDPVPIDDSRSRSGYKAAPTSQEYGRPQQSSPHSHLPPIETRMDVDPREGPPSSNRSSSRYQSSDERRTGRRSRSPNDRYGPPSMNDPPSARHDTIPSGPRNWEENRAVDQSRAPERRQPEPPRRRDERDLPPRDNDGGRRDFPPHSNLPPIGPKPLTGTNSIPINTNARRSTGAEPPLPPAPAVQPQLAPQGTPPFMSALPPAAALLDPSKAPRPPNVGGQQPDHKSSDIPLNQRVQPAPNPPNRPTEPRAPRRTRFDQPTIPPKRAPSPSSVESQERHQRATPPPMSREPSLSMKSKSSSERLSDVAAEKSGPYEERTEERTEIRVSEVSISLIDRFSEDRSVRVERNERDGPHSRFGEAVGPPLPSVPRPSHGSRNLNLPPRPQVSPEVLPPQLQRPVNGRVDDHHDRDTRMDTGHDQPPHLHDRNFQGPSSKVSLLERLSSADNVHEPQSLRERIVPSKRDREEMVGRDRPDGRDAPYDMDDGMDPKRQRRRGAGRSRRSNTGGGRR